MNTKILEVNKNIKYRINDKNPELKPEDLKLIVNTGNDRKLNRKSLGLFRKEIASWNF